jgi:hypothetical protein
VEIPKYERLPARATRPRCLNALYPDAAYKTAHNTLFGRGCLFFTVAMAI